MVISQHIIKLKIFITAQTLEARKVVGFGDRLSKNLDEPFYFFRLWVAVLGGALQGTRLYQLCSLTLDPAGGPSVEIFGESRREPNLTAVS